MKDRSDGKMRRKK